MLLKPEIENILLESGAVKARLTPLTRVPADEAGRYLQWIEKGYYAGMDYMTRNNDIRFNPMLLLEGAKSIITVAFNYTPAEMRDPSLPQIATFAYGRDYHNVIRRALGKVVERLKNDFEGDFRVCVDSAPLLERFWALRSGLGTRCDNGLVTVGQYGTRVILAEILTTLPHDTLMDTERTDPQPTVSFGRKIGEKSDRSIIAGGCTHCGACQRACPAGALQPDGTLNARRCLSYLTIEHSGDWDEEGKEAMSTPEGRRTLFGCDICQNVCPLNVGAPVTRVAAFIPRPGMMTLDAADILSMNEEEFDKRFAGSSLRRTRYDGMRRNALNIATDSGYIFPVLSEV